MPVASKLDSFALPPLYPRDLGERLEMPPVTGGFQAICHPGGV